jgi:hypothetical protein
LSTEVTFFLRDAGYLGFCVAHGVDGLAGFLVPPAGRAEVEAAEQFADEEDVGTLGDLRAQGRIGGEGGIGDGGAQVGEAAERLADLEQAGFGALVRREGVELVVADGAHEDGVGLEAGVERSRGQRRSGRVNGDSADQQRHEGEVVAAELGDGFEDVDGFVGDFRADAVAGEDGYLKTHSLTPKAKA